MTLRLSVIIPSHERPEAVCRTLAALARQTVGCAAFEAVVVADGCGPATVDRIREASTPFPMVVLQQDCQGAGSARNAGARRAAAPLLVFLDDDIEPEPGLLAAYEAAHREAPDAVLLGDTPAAIAGASLFHRALRQWWNDHTIRVRRSDHRFGYRDLHSGNFCLSRELFEAIGGFHPGFHQRAGEDHELGARLIARGTPFRFVPGARGFHHDATALSRSLARARDEGRGDVLLGTLHPDLRNSLPLARWWRAPGRARTSLRELTFRRPVWGDRAAWLLQRALPLLELLRLRRRYQKAYGALRGYWYCRGAAEELGDTGRQAELRRFFSAAPPLAPLLDLDLAAGLGTARAMLERYRPAGARLRAGRVPIGLLPPIPGTEPLEGRHLNGRLLDLGNELLAGLAWSAGQECGTPDALLRPDPPAPGALPGPQYLEFETLTLPTRTWWAPSVNRRAAPRETPLEGQWYAPASAWNETLKVLPGLPPPGEEGEGGNGLVPADVAVWDSGLPGPGLLTGATGGPLRVLVRARGRPAAWVSLSAEDAALPGRAGAVLAAGAGASEEPCPAAGAEESGSGRLPAISVVVCTRNRPAELESCLRSLARLRYSGVELIVIDNAPSDGRSREVAARFPVRYILEPRAGLDWARNRGISEASHEIIAFTDDDVQVDPDWLRGIAAGFRDPRVMAVTGLVGPLELNTRAQVLFEQVYGGMGKGLRPRLFHRACMSPSAHLAIYRVGVGANMAFRRPALQALGGFDTALDVGTPAHGGGDLDMFYRLVHHGMLLRYEPRALVWHRHRRDLPALRHQLADDGRAFGVYLLKRWSEGDAPRAAVIRFALGRWLPWLLGRVLLGLSGRHRLSLPLLWAPITGLARAPAAWRVTRQRDRTLRQPAGCCPAPWSSWPSP